MVPEGNNKLNYQFQMYSRLSGLSNDIHQKIPISCENQATSSLKSLKSVKKVKTLDFDPQNEGNCEN